MRIGQALKVKLVFCHEWAKRTGFFKPNIISTISTNNNQKKGKN